MNRFENTVHNLESWEEIYQSIDAFRALIEMLYEKHHIPCPSIKHLTPGTNAVFRVGETAGQVYVHGDLTGENVLVCPDGSLRIIDFGDSRIAAPTYE